MPAVGVAVGQRSILVLGGARSGKSGFAERLARETRGTVVYVATATAEDEEMAERIAHHRARRPPAWRTLEAPTELAARVPGVGGMAAVTVIVEDLTLLLSNLMRVAPRDFEDRGTREVDALLALDVATLIMVSNEVGLGIVPPYPAGRAFRDALGRVNQHAAERCDAAYLLVAGLPLRLK